MFNRFLQQDEFADRMLRAGDQSQKPSTETVADKTPPSQSAEKSNTQKPEEDWETVERPGDSGGRATEESWEDLGSSKPTENQEGGATSAEKNKKA